jgi:hypothetical protein
MEPTADGVKVERGVSYVSAPESLNMASLKTSPTGLNEEAVILKGLHVQQDCCQSAMAH